MIGELGSGMKYTDVEIEQPERSTTDWDLNCFVEISS